MRSLKISNDEVPPEALFKATGERFDRILEKYTHQGDVSSSFLEEDATHLTQIHPDRLNSFTEELARDLEADPQWLSRMTGTPEEKAIEIRRFALKAVHAFLENDLLTAQRLVMRRATGTFGVISSSSLCPDRVVATSRKQELYLGLSQAEELITPQGQKTVGIKLAGISSDWSSIKTGPFDYGVFFNSDGETAEVLMTDDGAFANFYPEPLLEDPERVEAAPLESPLSNDDLRARLEPLKGNKYISAVPSKQGSDAVQKNQQEAVKAIQWVIDSFTPPEDPSEELSFNLQTMKNYARDYLAIGFGEAIRRKIPEKVDHYFVSARINLHAEQIVVNLLSKKIDYQEAEQLNY